MKNLYMIFILCFLFFSSPLRAESIATPLVPVSDAVYGVIDLFLSHQLIHERVMGQRPYSRSEIARLLEEALQNFNKQKIDENEVGSSKKYIKTLLDYWCGSYACNKSAAPSEWHFLESTSFETAYLNSSPRPYFELPGTSYNPLVSYESGKHYVKGAQSFLETNHWFRMGPHVAGFVEPRLQLEYLHQEGAEKQAVFLGQGYASFVLANTQFVVGRQPIQWGQTQQGGFLFSNHARALDAIHISNPTPWTFKYVGSLKYGLFLANLGPEQIYPYPFLLGMKVSWLPIPYLEFGIARALIFGGEGAPIASFWTQIGETFGARPAGGDVGNFSSSLNGFELRGRIPPLRGLEIYSEVYFEDFNSAHIFRSFDQDTAILVGLLLPRLDEKGSWQTALEWRRTTDLLYENSTWPTGWTMNGLVLGDPLGADAESFSLHLKKRWSPELEGNGSLQWERVDSDIFTGSGARGREIVTKQTSEYRVRSLLSLQYNWLPWWQWMGTAGYEWVDNFNFIVNNTKNNFLVRLGMKVILDEWTRR